MNIPTVSKGFLPSSLFSDRIFSEFVSGSAIDPHQFGSSITIVQDTEARHSPTQGIMDGIADFSACADLGVLNDRNARSK